MSTIGAGVHTGSNSVLVAPVKVGVFPLLKNKPELVAKAREVYTILKKKHGNVMWDDNGNIGKRYRRQDEIGTPFCFTIDHQSLEDRTVTLRDRDSLAQERLPIDGLAQCASYRTSAAAELGRDLALALAALVQQVDRASFHAS